MRVYEIRYRFEVLRTSKLVVTASSFGQAEAAGKERLELDMGLDNAEIYEIKCLGDVPR